MVPWNSARTKVQLRLAVQRLRMVQQKKEAQAKSARRDIATLIERGKLETARVKVENIINEDLHVELLELLELYCELVLARFGLLELSGKEPDPGISEGICSIVHAAPRTELKELHMLREMLMHKFGRDFSIAVMENRNNCVNERVMQKLIISTPSRTLVDAYLTEIARGYHIDWTPPKDTNEDDNLKDSVPEPATSLSEKTQDSGSESASAAEASIDAKELDFKLPQPPQPSDEKRPPPYDPTAKPTKSAMKPNTTTAEPPTSAQEDEFANLLKRFEALKKR